MDITQVKKTIKQWEALFLKKNNRPPTKSDVRKDPTVRLLYQTYNDLKRGTTSVRAATTPRKEKPKEILLPDELGPTPQANGRVLSLFDHQLTPPRSSPLKTPTKKDPYLPPTSTTSLSLMDKLMAAALPQKSPLKPFATPTKSQPSLAASPSPFKAQRFAGRLTKVFIEATAPIVEEMEDEDRLLFAEEIDSEEVKQDDEPQYPSRKAKTQKRSTRHWKIKPRGVDQGPDRVAGKNLQAELRRLAETTAPTFADGNSTLLGEHRQVRDSDDDESDSEPEDTTYKRPKVVNGVAPIGQNFQRARINDPRIAKFKRRVKR